MPASLTAPVANELQAVNTVLSYWTDAVPVAAWITIFWVVIIVVNIGMFFCGVVTCPYHADPFTGAVNFFGEIEVICSMIKFGWIFIVIISGIVSSRHFTLPLRPLHLTPRPQSRSSPQEAHRARQTHPLDSATGTKSPSSTASKVSCPSCRRVFSPWLDPRMQVSLQPKPRTLVAPFQRPWVPSGSVSACSTSWVA